MFLLLILFLSVSVSVSGKRVRDSDSVVSKIMTATRVDVCALAVMGQRVAACLRRRNIVSPVYVEFTSKDVTHESEQSAADVVDDVLTYGRRARIPTRRVDPREARFAMRIVVDIPGPLSLHDLQRIVDATAEGRAKFK